MFDAPRSPVSSRPVRPLRGRRSRAALGHADSLRRRWPSPRRCAAVPLAPLGAHLLGERRTRANSVAARPPRGRPPCARAGAFHAARAAGPGPWSRWTPISTPGRRATAAEVSIRSLATRTGGTSTPLELPDAQQWQPATKAFGARSRVEPLTGGAAIGYRAALIPPGADNAVRLMPAVRREGAGRLHPGRRRRELARAPAVRPRSEGDLGRRRRHRGLGRRRGARHERADSPARRPARARRPGAPHLAQRTPARNVWLATAQPDALADGRAAGGGCRCGGEHRIRNLRRALHGERRSRASGWAPPDAPPSPWSPSVRRSPPCSSAGAARSSCCAPSG